MRMKRRIRKIDPDGLTRECEFDILKVRNRYVIFYQETEMPTINQLVRKGREKAKKKRNILQNNENEVKTFKSDKKQFIRLK